MNKCRFNSVLVLIDFTTSKSWIGIVQHLHIVVSCMSFFCRAQKMIFWRNLVTKNISHWLLQYGRNQNTMEVNGYCQYSSTYLLLCSPGKKLVQVWNIMVKDDNFHFWVNDLFKIKLDWNSIKVFLMRNLISYNCSFKLTMGFISRLSPSTLPYRSVAFLAFSTNSYMNDHRETPTSYLMWYTTLD